MTQSAKTQWNYSPSRTPVAKVQRRVTQWRRACLAQVAPDRPMVTLHLR